MPRPDGYSAGKDAINIKELNGAVRIYLRMRGIDPESAIPTREALERLGLKDVANKLDKTLAIANPPAEHPLKSKK